jgi:hypothetical protein
MDRFKKAQKILDEVIESKIGDYLKQTDPELEGISDVVPDEIFLDFEDYNFDINPIEKRSDRKEAENYMPEGTDNFLNSNVALPRGDHFIKGRVTQRKLAPDRTPLGIADRIPILDTRECEVDFTKGTMETYATSLIAENLYSQVAAEGYESLYLDCILDHRKDGSAVSKDNQYMRLYNGTMCQCITTKGWKMLVQWKDGSSSWEPLRNLKDSNPVDVAKYSVANKIAEEAAFSWWVKNTLRDRERIISKVKSQTHKYRVQLPKMVQAAYRINRNTGTDLRRKAIEKEMKNVMFAFEINDNNKVPIGFTKIDCHMVFNVKMDLTR